MILSYFPSIARFFFFVKSFLHFFAILSLFHRTNLHISQGNIGGISQSQCRYNLDLYPTSWQKIHQWKQSKIASKRQSTARASRNNCGNNSSKKSTFFTSFCIARGIALINKGKNKERKEGKCEKWESYIRVCVKCPIITKHNFGIGKMPPNPHL